MEPSLLDQNDPSAPPTPPSAEMLVLSWAFVIAEYILSELAAGRRSNAQGLLDRIAKQPDRTVLGRSLIAAAKKGYLTAYEAGKDPDKIKLVSFDHMHRWRDTLEFIRDNWQAATEKAKA